MGQSSNDVVPTAIHIGGCLLIKEQLIPALEHLAAAIAARKDELRDTVKTGRTHLMDAMPVTMAQELSGWETQVRHGAQRLDAALQRLLALPQGGNGGRYWHQCTAAIQRTFCKAAGRHDRDFLSRQRQSFRGA